MRRRPPLSPDELFRIGRRWPELNTPYGDELTHADMVARARLALRYLPDRLQDLLDAIQRPADPDSAPRAQAVLQELQRDTSPISLDRLWKIVAFLVHVRDGAAIASYGPGEKVRLCKAPGCRAPAPKGERLCGQCSAFFTAAVEMTHPRRHPVARRAWSQRRRGRPPLPPNSAPGAKLATIAVSRRCAHVLWPVALASLAAISMLVPLFVLPMQPASDVVEISGGKPVPPPPPAKRPPPPPPKDKSRDKGKPVPNPDWDRVIMGRAGAFFRVGECNGLSDALMEFSPRCRPAPAAPAEEHEEWERRYGP